MENSLKPFQKNVSNLFQSTLKPWQAHMHIEVKEINKTKIIIVLLTASMIILAAIGVAYAQITNAQNQNSAYTQIPGQLHPSNGAYGYGYYVPLNNGTYAYYPCYPYAAAQTGQTARQAPAPQTPYQYGCRMGMCGRFW